ncbi:hypothetical protein PS467_04270 [Streptomyces luomodiensis]|uniref:Uncharacterized protein n=1 Tax=Streptomyces luomodiensis TaxID=3026192 RepID=A0ABY9URR7_9ACTN|nr:hypothetical protein [Streptomyces sp. SCA4-21]WNE94605.1 hypothetical protein PS467_04270 [Streptomyces sp. SCA4-21]
MTIAVTAVTAVTAVSRWPGISDWNTATRSVPAARNPRCTTVS